MTQPVPAGTVQYECPMHIHRAPEPRTERRTMFVAWDHHRFVNASTTTVFADNWRKQWYMKRNWESDPDLSRRKARKKQKVSDDAK